MNSRKLLLGFAMGSALLIGSSRTLSAGSTPANLTVSTSVVANCTITTTAVTFPAYDPVVTNTTNPDDSTAGMVTIACTKGTGTSISLGLGANVSGTQPRMKGPGASDYLNYTLYSDTGRATTWSGVTRTITPALSKAPQDFQVYGRIPGGQDTSAGTYTDTVVATVVF